MGLVLVLCTIALLVGAVHSRVSISPVSAHTHEEIVEFWTTERMAAAVPYDDTNYDFIADSMEEQENEPQGDVRFIPGYYNGTYFDGVNLNQSYSQGYLPGNSTLPFISGYISNYTEYPYCAMGKVLATFEKSFQFCSAAVVGENFVYTAAHCVYGEEGWATYVKFEPGYKDYKQPFGTFTGYRMMIPEQFIHPNGTAKFHRAYDLAVVVLNRQDNKTVRETVGSLPIAFNLGYNDTDWVSYGYPTEAPFGGQLNYFCAGDSTVVDPGFSPSPIGIGCNATQGSSGGPRFVFDSLLKASYINSVNGYRDKNYSSVSFGSYFGAMAEQLFDEASSINPSN